MESTALTAQRRAKTGTKAARSLRSGGRLPVVIYGHGEPVECVSLSTHDVTVAIAHGARLLEVDTGSESKKYLIKDVQYDHFDSTPIHLDLARVDLHERVKVRVGIELRGVPKGVSEGGIVDQQMPDIEVECLVTEIPDTLHPMITELTVGESLLVKDLDLPAGVFALADADATVATVRAPAAEVEAEPAAETEGVSEEPERIGRVRKEEEETKEDKR